MPWKNPESVPPRVARWRFVQACLAGGEAFAALCRRFGVSRPTGYKYWRRFLTHGRAGLAARVRGPRRTAARWRRWRREVLALRRRWPTWGARKLRWRLRQRHPHGALPAARTLGRWLRAAGVVARRRQRHRRGPRLPALPRTVARRANDVWTLDFKGRFRTGDGRRVEPLTVRDLASRYVLAVQAVRAPSVPVVRAQLLRLFRRHGLPRALWIDNGAPFGGSGALGLSRLSVWWLRLGLRVEFSRRGRPQDNAAHEQMHRVLKAETARPPAGTLAAQQRRFGRWRHDYNHRRPHEALGLRPPARRYRPSPRRCPRTLPPLVYPAHWVVRRVAASGRIQWGRRPRVIGVAFAGERIGLRLRHGGRHEVWLGTHLLGWLLANDLAGLRPARRQPRGGGG
jgi:putative transposase